VKEAGDDFKRPPARTFHGQFAFSRPKTRFQVPASLLRTNKLPRLRCRFDRLIGNQVPDLFLHSPFDAQQPIRITCMPELCPANITRHFWCGRHVKEFLVPTRRFPSAHLPYVLFHSVALKKCVLFEPSDHACDLPCLKHLYAWTRCLSAITHLNQKITPFPDPWSEQLFFLLSGMGCIAPLCCPATHPCSLRKAFEPCTSCAGPMPAPHHHRSCCWQGKNLSFF
jgi:hypothetical protein